MDKYKVNLTIRGSGLKMKKRNLGVGVSHTDIRRGLQKHSHQCHCRDCQTIGGQPELAGSKPNRRAGSRFLTRSGDVSHLLCLDSLSADVSAADKLLEEL